jgi:catechol 2,3-dioxygenase-like lactoylglutathione lyase family enzyme
LTSPADVARAPSPRVENPRYRFYKQLLGQAVKYDFEPNVTFEGDFSIHLKSRLRELMGGVVDIPAAGTARHGELCFEADDIDGLCERLEREAVAFVHAIQEQPWAQRVARLRDPDGHLVEIGEAMEAVVRRLRGQGLSAEEIRARAGMPREFMEGAVG